MRCLSPIRPAKPPIRGRAQQAQPSGAKCQQMAAAEENEDVECTISIPPAGIDKKKHKQTRKHNTDVLS